MTEVHATRRIHSAEHTIEVAAPPDTVYGLIADVTAWPHLFPPTIHAERAACTDTEERIRLWALAGGEVKTWTSRRWLDAGARRIRFRQEVSHPPVDSMTGEWSMRPGRDGGTRLVLTHTFSVIGDAPETVAYIAQTIDRNSGSELAAVKSLSEGAAELPELLVSFSDSVLVDGDLAEVYDFVYRAQDWPQRLPHVSRLDLREDENGLQVMEMDTRTPSGDVHTTRSIRVCFPPGRIVYRQVVVPAVMTAHTGEWTFNKTADGVLATSQHTVVIAKDAALAALGPGGTLAAARQRVRETLGANSLTTLRQAKAHVEGSHVEGGR
jgi:ribosome-associated toxin RatA of RatAB toxin-antitoxin module